jgi:hypothetical protein
MKTAILATLVGAAAAFAPAQQKASSTSLNAFEDALGAQPPLGLFDPLGLVANGDQDRFDRLRYVEIKHGRVSMLAFLGNIITRAGLFLPGSIDKDGDSFDSFGVGWHAVGSDGISRAGIYQIVAFIGFLELVVMKDVNGKGQFPGDFRNGIFDAEWEKFGPETQLKKRAIELNNGRAAMLGIFGLMVHEQLGGELPLVGKM